MADLAFQSTGTDSHYKTLMCRELQNGKKNLLLRVEASHECPQSYRDSLRERLYAIDPFKIEAYTQLDKIESEIGTLAFQLQMNPAWIRGLSPLVNEILDHTERDQRTQLISSFSQLKEQVFLLKCICRRYQLKR